MRTKEEGTDDGGELVGNEVCGDEVADCHADTGGEGNGPELLDAALAVEHCEEHEGEPDEEERGDARASLGQEGGLRAAEFGGGDHRDRHCAECDVQGVRNHGDEGGFEGFQSEGKEHRAGDGDRSTEARKAFHERAERGRDEERLNADIALADSGEDGANIIAAPGDLGEVVEPYRGNDDVADDKQAESSALRR